MLVAAQDRRLLVLATTSNRPMLVDMDLADAFLADIRVPAITSLRSVDHVVRETGLFQSQAEHDRCMSLLQSAGIEESGRLNIGIKKVRGSVALARQSADRRRHSFCPRSRWHALTPVRRVAPTSAVRPQADTSLHQTRLTS